MSTFAHHIRPAVQAELDAAAAAESRGNFYTAFKHLERAHVLGQRATREHVRVHWQMLRFAVRQRRSGEAAGQLARLLAASVLTAFGLVPQGNAGGSKVSAWRRMPLPADLQQLIATAVSRSQHHVQGTIMLTRIATAVAIASFVFLAAGCGTPPSDLDLALEKTSSAGAYRVALLRPAEAPAINQMHSWKVRLTTPSGAPVGGARVGVAGGMPQHGHGFPTQPRVTRELEAGTYLLEGMKFSMTGWWQVGLDIDGPQGRDQVSFNTVVERPGARL